MSMGAVIDLVLAPVDVIVSVDPGRTMVDQVTESLIEPYQAPLVAVKGWKGVHTSEDVPVVSPNYIALNTTVETPTASCLVEELDSGEPTVTMRRGRRVGRASRQIGWWGWLRSGEEVTSKRILVEYISTKPLMGVVSKWDTRVSIPCCDP